MSLTVAPFAPIRPPAVADDPVAVGGDAGPLVANSHLRGPQSTYQVLIDEAGREPSKEKWGGGSSWGKKEVGVEDASVSLSSRGHYWKIGGPPGGRGANCFGALCQRQVSTRR